MVKIMKMDRRELKSSSGEIWHWLDDNGRPVIFKSIVCEDMIFLPSVKVTAMPGLAGCMSWTGAPDMT